MSPQFVRNKVSLWLHSKFAPEIAQEIEGCFGFDPTLARIANRFRHLRTRYKHLSAQYFQVLVDFQRAPEIVFRQHINAWSVWKHENYYKLVESALILFSDSLEMLGKKKYSGQVHNVQRSLVQMNARAFFYPASAVHMRS